MGRANCEARIFVLTNIISNSFYGGSMYKNFFKLIPIAFLLLLFVVPQSLLAQDIPVVNSDAERIIKQYESGNLTNATFAEKQIISEYKASLESARPYIPPQIYSPEAIILTEDFDAVTPPALPTGWTAENTNADTEEWETSTNDPYSGANSMHIYYNFTEAMDDWFFTPGLALTGGVTYRVQFQYSSGSYTESMEVKWGTSATSGGMTEGPIFDNPAFNNTSYTLGQGTFTPTTTGTYYVGWHGYSAANEYYIVVDDVVIDENPAGPPDPAVVVNPLDAETDVPTTTTLDWAAGGGAAPTGYRLYFGTDGGGVTLPTSIENNTNLGLVTQYTPASPLTIGTTYYWSLVPYNGDGDATGNPIWSFTTVSPIAEPYNENFNAGTADGWLTNGWGLYSTSGVDGSYCIGENYYSLNTDTWVSAPIVGPISATSQLQFEYRIVDYGTLDPTVLDGDYFDLQISTDGGANFTTIYTINSSNHVTSDQFALVTVDIGTSYSGQSVMFRLDGHWDTAGDYYFFIDNFYIGTPTYGDLDGTITDCVSAANLAGVTVSVDGQSTTTNGSGYYQFTGLLSGTYDITASVCGYENTTITGVSVTESGTTQDFCMNEFLVPPVNLSSNVTGQDVSLTWQAPGTVQPDQFIQWDDGTNVNSIGAGGPFVFDVAQRWPVEDIIPYDGMYITNVVFFPAEATATYTIKIWQGDDANSLTEVYSQSVPSPTIDAFNDIALTTSVQICGTQELFIGYSVDTPTGYPAGCGPGPAVPDKGFMINEGAGWYDLSQASTLDYNWNIAGYVSSTAAAPNSSLIYSYAIEDDAFAPKSPLTDYDIMKINSMNSTPFTAVESSQRKAYKLINENTTLVSNQQNGDGADATLLGYNVYRDGASIATNVTNLFYDDNSLAYGYYNYTVTANYSEGESMPVSVYAAVLPSAATIPFAENFDGTWPGNWLVINGSETNQWFVGTAAGPVSSPNSIYVSSDGGTTWGYDENSSSVVHFWRDITFSGSIGGGYKLTFQWKGEGEATTWDHLRVYLVGTDVYPVPGTELPTADRIGDAQYNDQTDYVEASIIIPDAVSGDMRLVFSWKNDGTLSNGNPASVDDISITVQTTGTLSGTVTDCASSANLGGALVTAGSFSTTTNSSGDYSLTVPDGTYDVTASRVGYASATVTGVVVTAGGTTTQDFCLDQSLIPPANLQSSVAGQDVSLTWQEPPSFVLRWDDGTSVNAIGSSAAGTIEAAARFDADIMASYTTTQLEQVEIFISAMPNTCQLTIYGEGTETTPGAVLYTEDVLSSVVAGEFNTFTLSSPLAIDGQDIWISYTVDYDAEKYPCGVGPGPAAVDGFWINDGGWVRLMRSPL